MKALLTRLLAQLTLKLFAIIPLSFARGLGVFAALILNRTKNDVQRITKINLAMTQPHLSAEQLDKLCKESVRSTLINSFEMPVIWQQSEQWVFNKIERVDNVNIFEESLAKGKGVILVCPHIGSWEFFGRYLTPRAKTTYLYQPPKIKAFESIVKSGREKAGAQIVATNQRGIAKVLKALRNGEVTGILPDQVPKPPSGQYANFFSVPAYTMTLIHGLVQKTHCEVVLGIALRTKKGFHIIFESVPDAIYSEDLQTSVQALSDIVEQAIVKDVAQYQWAYKRFKLQPDSPSPYQRKK